MKSEYILNIFNSQGNEAYNEEIGKVELSKSGAKSTVLHGFGADKLAAAKAVKNVIESGNIIEYSDNYKNGIISVELNSTKDIGGKYEDYNVIVTMFSSDDNYAKNLISGDDVTVKYQKEDLSQVNPQLYTWLAIINDKSSDDNIISQDENTVNDNIRETVKNDNVKNANLLKNEDFNKLDINAAVESTIYKQFKENDVELFEKEYGGKGFSGLTERLIENYKKREI